MHLFDVYPLFNIEPIKAKDVYIWDKNGERYLDLYGGHAVISIGHSHPVYISSIADQLNKIGFYSNSIINSLQIELADKLGKLSGYDNYSLFLCNSGAEAVENALKLSALHNHKSRIVTFDQAFHGRTSAAVSVTDNSNIQSSIDLQRSVKCLPLNDIRQVEQEIEKGDVSSVIVEGIQGIGGIRLPEKTFLRKLQKLCSDNDVVLILDEIQSGYGRSGKFFAHQHSGIQPDIITTAKGMANGFPIGGVLISPKFESRHGMLGSTFGGNHLACVAATATLEVIEKEKLVENAAIVGDYLIGRLSEIKQIKETRGLGLMIGIEFDFSIKEIRHQLLSKHRIFTGVSGTNIIRLLPPLTITKKEIDCFIQALKQVLNEG